LSWIFTTQKKEKEKERKRGKRKGRKRGRKQRNGQYNAGALYLHGNKPCVGLFEISMSNTL